MTFGGKRRSDTPKRMREFQLSKTAESDISLIADYTIFKFGIGQARKYRNGLIDTFNRLALNPKLGRAFMMPYNLGLKRYRYEAHMVFYKETSTGILIVRVLGGMMDFKRHL